MVIEMCGNCKWYSAKNVEWVFDTKCRRLRTPIFETKCRKRRIPTIASALAVTMDCKDWEPKEGE